ADLGVVSVARDVDEARIETMERIAPCQDANGAALVEIDDAADDADQVLHARLKQLVSRVGFQNVQYGFTVVPRGVQSEVLDHSLDFAPQHRNVTRATEVRTRGPQTEEAVLANDPALRVEPFDADVIEILSPMNGCDGVRLRDDEHLA